MTSTARPSELITVHYSTHWTASAPPYDEPPAVFDPIERHR